MSNILPVYNNINLTFNYGEDCYLYNDKDKYLDFGSGIATNSLGYNNKRINNIAQKQLEKPIHISNLFKIKEAEDLAANICRKIFVDYVFFVNSGSEAIETAIKLARNYFFKNRNIKADKLLNDNEIPYIITFDNSFHGRSITNISATRRNKYLNNFYPALEGFKLAKFNDINSVKDIISSLPEKNIAAIMIELIQGEGGINIADKEFIVKLKEICNEYDILLILDEVQCGNGRTGYLYSYDYYNIIPDIISTAKAFGNGFPIGACFTKKNIGDKMESSSHGSTYGGNPFCASIANEIFNIISDPEFLLKVKKISKELILMLKELKLKYKNIIKDIRHAGLMIGIEFYEEYNNIDIMKSLLNNFLITIPASNNVLRLLPPLIIEQKHINEAINKIDATLNYY